METKRHGTDLAALARMYTARAQPVPGATPGTEDTEPMEVEIRLLTTVHDAVRLRAANQEQEVAEVARAVLFKAAADVTPRMVTAYQEKVQARARDFGQRAADREARREGSTRASVDKAYQSAMDRSLRSRRPLREYVGGGARHRLRFTAPRQPYVAARDAILASGRTVASAVEDGLKVYARTGQL